MARPRALLIHHDADSLPGLLVGVLDDLGFDLDERRLVDPTGVGDPTGSFESIAEDAPLAGVDLVVSLGSAWSVDNAAVRHWVDPELDLLRHADERGIPCLGICFGGQLLAVAHGGEVARTEHPEIGWMQIEPAPDSPIVAGPWFQWHLDHFTLPPRAAPLARSAAGLQSFALRRNLALLFLPEVDDDVLRSWLGPDPSELIDRGIDPDALLAETSRTVPTTLPRTMELVTSFLDRCSSAP